MRGELLYVFGQQLTVGADLNFHRALANGFDADFCAIDSMTAEVDVGKRHGTADQCDRNCRDYRYAFDLGCFGFCSCTIHPEPPFTLKTV